MIKYILLHYNHREQIAWVLGVLKCFNILVIVNVV